MGVSSELIKAFNYCISSSQAAMNSLRFFENILVVGCKQKVWIKYLLSKYLSGVSLKIKNILNYLFYF